MTAEPTTPTSRRTMWKTDAIELVERFQAHARGEGSESFPPWRIGYMAGLAEVEEKPDRFEATIHRTCPSIVRQRASIPKAGKPSAALIDLLCWHMDQDVRRYDREDDDRDGMWHRLPEGPLLIDPLLRVLLEDAGTTAEQLMWRLADEEGFGVRRKVATSLGRNSSIGRMEIVMRMNEMHARFDLPGTDVTWSRGCLMVDLAHLPETTLVAARGRPLRDLVRHDVVDRATDVLITGTSQNNDGTRTLTTQAARAEGMVAGPQRKPAAI